MRELLATCLHQTPIYKCAECLLVRLKQSDLQYHEMVDHAAALRVALRKYGGHSSNCRWASTIPKETCDCGLLQTFAAVPEDYRKVIENRVEPVRNESCKICGQIHGAVCNFF